MGGSVFVLTLLFTGQLHFTSNCHSVFHQRETTTYFVITTQKDIAKGVQFVGSPFFIFFAEIISSNQGVQNEKRVCRCFSLPASDPLLFAPLCSRVKVCSLLWSTGSSFSETDSVPSDFDQRF